MVEFKKGDRVIVSGEPETYRNGTGVIEDVGVSLCGVRMDTGDYIAVRKERITYYVEIKMQVTPVPPQKIQHDGYEYELIGPVKPDWLVDGVWVVRNDNGVKYNIVSKNGAFFLNDGVKDLIIDYSSFFSDYRPHTPEDFKWGDWAMYYGKRVFVMGGVDEVGDIAVSYPDIGYEGYRDVERNYSYVHASKLTPTF